jgi:N-acetylmuramoyl-L-alanine amidase CwlA
MAYTFKQNMLTSSKYSKKSPYPMTPEGICIHNTANNAPAAREIAYMIGNDASVSFHVAVDDQDVIQAVPFNRNCWASGDGSSGNGNRKHIHIEICYSLSGGAKFDQGEKNAAAYTAKLLKEYGWDLSKVKKHKDFTDKNCPHRTLSMGWQRFIDMVKSELDALNDAPEVENTPIKIGTYNKQVETTTILNVRSARNANSEILAKLPKGTVITVGYILYEDNKTTGEALWGGVTVSKKQGFIHMGYVKEKVTKN